MARDATSPQVSAIERLQSLPALFLGGELTRRFEWTSKSASQYLYLWRRRRLVEPLGGHSDVYANLLVDRNPDWGRAFVMAMPSSLAIGVEALRQAGWTTQILTRPTVAVMRNQRIFKVDRFDIRPQPERWFRAIRRPGAVLKDSQSGLPRLAPAWALADLLRKERWGAFGLWPDDIDWDEVTAADRVAWSDAVVAFGFDAAKLSELAQPFGAEPRSR